MKRTLQETLVTGLLAIGAREIAGRSSKYRTFASLNNPGWFYFVGSNGALRFGKTSSESRSLEGSKIRATILAKGAEPIDKSLFPSHEPKES